MNSQDSPFPIPLAIAVPQTFPNGNIDLGMIRSYASRAEELGYHSLWGSVEQCVEGLMEVGGAGAGMLMLDPVFDYEEHLERLASEVAPKLGPPISS